MFAPSRMNGQIETTTKNKHIKDNTVYNVRATLENTDFCILFSLPSINQMP